MVTAAQERATAAVAWLSGRGGVATPGELGKALDLNHARQAETTRAAVEAGWMVRAGSELHLTPAGWAHLAPADPIGAGRVVDEVTAAAWPDWAGPHAAFLRLLVSATIGKHRLWDAGRQDHHLAFWAAGPQGAGKTVLAVLACHVLGLDWRRHVVQLDEETAGSLRGRRGQDDDGWRLDSPAIAGLPLVLFDELDKAPEPARRAAWRYIRGQGLVVIEGREHELRPVAMVAANPPADQARLWELAPEGTRRRAVMLNAGYLSPERRQELGDHLRRVLPKLSPLDRLSLDRLPELPATLDDEAAELLAAVRVMALPALGPLPAVGLELAALGRLALLADGDHVRAAVGTAIDYLTVTATTPGLVHPDWPDSMSKVRQWAADGGRDEVTAALDRAARARETSRELVRRQTVERNTAVDELVRDRAATVALLDEGRRCLDPRTVRTWPAPVKVRAAGVRAQLGHLRGEAACTRSRPALEDVTARSAGPLADARALVSEVEQARQDAERDRQHAQRARERERAQAVAAKAAAAGDLDRLMPSITRLERLYGWSGPGEGASAPAAVLAAPFLPGDQRGLIRYVPPESASTRPAGFRAGLRAALAPDPGEWFTVYGESLGAGYPGRPPGMTFWGPGTRRLIGSVLAELYGVEDRLRAVAGRRARSRRVALAA